MLASRGADWKPFNGAGAVGTPQKGSPLQVQARCSPNSPSVMMCPGPAVWVLMLVVVMLGAGLSDLTFGKAVDVANRLKIGKPSLESRVYD